MNGIIVCKHCGGNMDYNPRENVLRCRNCNRETSLKGGEKHGKGKCEG